MDEPEKKIGAKYLQKGKARAGKMFLNEKKRNFCDSRCFALFKCY
jgi:hypothetical protein